MHVLQQASQIVNSKWRNSGSGKKIFIAVIGGTVLLVLAVVALGWATIKFLSALSKSLYVRQGRDFYYPARRKKSLYFPSRRR